MKRCLLFLMLAISIISFIPAIASDYQTDSSSYDASTNILMSSSNRVGMLIPAIMLVITIMCFAIDFGAVGVSAASAASLLVLFLLKIIYINWTSLISFILIVIIMIFRMSRS